jgi:hypothetical protein
VDAEVKLLIYSANLGNFDKPKDHEEQALPFGITQIDYFRYTDDNFPPRFNSMTPRLQARICKMMTWQMKPGYDYYLWVDASCRLSKEDSADWFMKQLGDADIAVFKHNKRETVQDEASFLKYRLEAEKEGSKRPYVLPRYENERIDDQLAVVDPEAELYASTAFIMKNDTPAKDLMTIWALHTFLYHSIDQLSLPHAIKASGVKARVIKQDYLKCPSPQYTRGKK